LQGKHRFFSLLILLETTERFFSFKKELYTNAIQCLPQKYNEIIRMLFNKEMRTYLPIEELNLLLEPIPSYDEEDVAETGSKDLSMSLSENESSATSDSDDDSLVDVNNEMTLDSSHSSVEDFANF